MTAMGLPPDAGSCGRFDPLPSDGQAPAPAAGSAPASASAGAPRASVLYIEDNAINAMLMEAIVGLRPNVKLRISCDGASALRDAASELPDLLLVDMHLPDADGIELLAVLRAPPVGCAAPAIVVSAAAGPDDLRRAREAGFVGYWTKPLEVARILTELDALLGPPPPADGAAG